MTNLMKDPPTCDFLKENIKAEKEAIESYTVESSRTDDLVWKRAISSISVDEMHHLEILEQIHRDLDCKE